MTRYAFPQRMHFALSGSSRLTLFFLGSSDIRDNRSMFAGDDAEQLCEQYTRALLYDLNIFPQQRHGPFSDPPRQFGLFSPARLRFTFNPVGPDAARPTIGVEKAQREDSPLPGFPRSVEPERLSDQAHNTSPPTPTLAAVLRKENGGDAEQGNTDLFNHAFTISA